MIWYDVVVVVVVWVWVSLMMWLYDSIDDCLGLIQHVTLLLIIIVVLLLMIWYVHLLPLPIILVLSLFPFFSFLHWSRDHIGDCCADTFLCYEWHCLAWHGHVPTMCDTVGQCMAIDYAAEAELSCWCGPISARVCAKGAFSLGELLQSESWCYKYFWYDMIVYYCDIFILLLCYIILLLCLFLLLLWYIVLLLWYMILLLWYMILLLCYIILLICLFILIVYSYFYCLFTLIFS